MKCRMPTILEPLIIRGIEGYIGDDYLMKIANGDLSLSMANLENFQEAKYIAIQMYYQWRGLGLK